MYCTAAAIAYSLVLWPVLKSLLGNRDCSRKPAHGAALEVFL